MSFKALLLYLHLLNPNAEFTCEDFFKDIHRLNRDFELIEAQCNPKGPTLIYKHVVASSSFGIDSPGMCKILINYKLPKIEMIFLDAFEHELFRTTTLPSDCIWSEGATADLQSQYQLESGLAVLDAFQKKGSRCTYRQPPSSVPYKVEPRDLL